VPSKEEITSTGKKNYMFKESIAEYIHPISPQTHGIIHAVTNITYVSHVGKP
jgi:hypothetical protein